MSTVQTAAEVVKKSEDSRALVFTNDLDAVLAQATQLKGVLYSLQSKLSGPSPTTDGPTPQDESSSFWTRINDTKIDIASTLEGCLATARKISSEFDI